MSVRRIFPALLSLVLAAGPAFADAPADLRAAFDAQVAADAQEIPLFNGVDLDGWQVCVRGLGASDPKGVFTVQDGALRVSGEMYGGLMTVGSYSNYRLTVKFKWGEQTWGARADKARDSGVLFHSFGPGDGFGGVWARSVEANVIEGGVGDFWIVGGPDDGVAATCDVVKRGSANVCTREGGTPVEITDNKHGCFQWVGRSPEWQDVKGFRGPNDVDRPNDWNELTIYAIDDAAEFYVNGQFVNRVYNLKPTVGKIQLQSEGAEIFFRDISLLPLD